MYVYTGLLYLQGTQVGLDKLYWLLKHVGKLATTVKPEAKSKVPGWV
jgi:hypothetical protein